MRKRNSIRNILSALISNATTTIAGLIAQPIFISILSVDYLGLNSLFSSIISMLAVAELGIGTAITYSLYKPIANNDTGQIRSLLNFYRKSYRAIMVIVASAGLLLIPFLHLIVNLDGTNVEVNLYVVYLLFLIDTTISYVLAYKRSLLYAQQKSYVTNSIKVLYTIIANACQLLLLALTRNYYIYLIIRVAMRLVESVATSIITDKMYSFVNNVRDAETLDTATRREIIKRVKALFLHKIGSFIVLGTDSIIISTFLGVGTVGLYANYNLILSAVKSLFGQIIDALGASVGNMLVTETPEKQFSVFKKIRFMNFWISTFTSTAMFVIFEPFITIWLGSEYILPIGVLLVLVINYFLNSMRACYRIFKESAGVFHEDRFIPLIESILNIIVSVILVQIIGLSGVFIGTIVSGLTLWLISYPKFVYKKLFKRSYLDYAKEMVGYVIVFLIILSTSISLSNTVNFSDAYLNFIIKAALGITLPNLLLIVMFLRSENLKYFFNLCAKKK